MRTRLLTLFLFLTSVGFAQPVELQIFTVPGGSQTQTKVGFRARSTGGTVEYLGLTFYMLYQSANATPVSYDDNRLVNTFAWGSSNRAVNQAMVPVAPITVDGRTYDRRFIYANIDETAGSNLITLTTAWDTLLYITFNNLQTTFPQGGYGYLEATSLSPGASLTDASFVNIPFSVSSSSLPLANTGTPLPVQFTRFGAQCSDNGTTVTWSTATERNNAYYEVEKSLDGNNWSSLGRVNGNSSRTYEFFDKTGGQAVYRVKQVDLNGAITYTTLVRTTCGNQSFFVNLYPVPARDKLTLVVGSDRTVKTTARVLDNNGRVVMTTPLNISKGTNNFTLDVNHLPQGQYYIRGGEQGLEINQRFTITR